MSVQSLAEGVGVVDQTGGGQDKKTYYGELSITIGRLDYWTFNGILVN